jgi:hypothetical protein
MACHDCTVHIYYGEAQALDPQRLKKRREIAKFLLPKQKRNSHGQKYDMR